MWFDVSSPLLLSSSPLLLGPPRARTTRSPPNRPLTRSPLFSILWLQDDSDQAQAKRQFDESDNKAELSHQLIAG